MKNLFRKITALLMTLCLIAGMTDLTTAYAAETELDWVGDGSADHPYEISSADHLAAIPEKDMNAHYIQMADIILPDLGVGVSNWTPIGSSFSDSFKGTFDGNGKTIYNLTIHNSTLEYVGLFGYIGSGARLENITLADVDIEAMYYQPAQGPGVAKGASAGALVGNSGSYTAPTISNCRSTGIVTGGDYAYVGGLVGDSGYITINYCSNIGDVTGGDYAYVGGLAGNIIGGSNSRINNSHSTGNITGGNNAKVGGLVGAGSLEINSSSYSGGGVTGGDSARVGGLAGGIAGNGQINNSHSTGSAAGGNNAKVGSLAGYLMNASISDSYNTGSITGGDYAYVGGLLGECNNGAISSSYNTGSITGGNNTVIGGLIGHNSDISTHLITNNYNTGSITGGAGAVIGGAIAYAYNSSCDIALNNIAITTQRAKLIYTVGEELDITGMVITGTYEYDNSSVLPVTTAHITGFNSGAAVTGQELTITFGGKSTTYTVDIVPSRGNGGNGGGGSLSSKPTVDSNGNINASPTLNQGTGVASAGIDIATLNTALSRNAENSGGGKHIKILLPAVQEALGYQLTLPSGALVSSGENTQYEIKTGIATVTLPGNMLAAEAGAGAQTASLTVARANTSGLDEEARSLIGSRPVIQLSLSVDGAPYIWSNETAPVTVSIPYTPSSAELANPEAIVIWYIDGSGSAVSVPNGRYDAETGTVTFSTTHFSCYAVSCKQVSFQDVTANAWYGKAVAFIAARDITTGTGSGNFSPNAKLTRGQFIVMLMKAYGIAADVNPKDNFADAGNTYYTGYLAAAKRLGISGGVGNNMYAPGNQITRQEMFTLLYNALKVIGSLPQGTKLPDGSSGKTLSDFSDGGDIASWAKDALTLLVETGTISGSGGKLTPTDTTTRAQMAQVLYNLLSK